MVHGMWTFKVPGVGEFLLTLTSDGRLTHAHRGPGPWDLSWGPPQECHPALDWISPDAVECHPVLDWISPDAVIERVRAERDRARDIAVALEQEIDGCRDGYWYHQKTSHG